MSLNDVWRNISKELGIYWKGRFDKVPAAPGVYAWFYPLRLTTKDLSKFLDEIRSVMAFDAFCNGPARESLLARFAWEQVDIDLRWGPSPALLPANVIAAWDGIVDDDERFERFRRVLMRGSLLMPPLYVGKTRSLLVRCQQHRAGAGAHDFHARYESFAGECGVQARTVSDLLFACVQTGPEPEAEDSSEDALEDVVEEILKHACRPRYGLK